MPELPDMASTVDALFENPVPDTEATSRYSPIKAGHPWWDYQDGSTEWETAWGVVGPTMVRQAAAGGAPVRELTRGGRPANVECTPEGFSKESGLRLVFENDLRTAAILSDADAFVVWTVRGTGRNTHMSIDMLTRSESIWEKVDSWCAANLVDHTDDSEAGPVYTLQQSPHGVHLMHLGTAGVPLVRSNYSEEVLQGFDHVGQELKAQSPCGRIVLLSGSTGTGKTHMIRALLRECPFGVFVLVPPSMLESIGDPRILPAILEVHSGTVGPIVFVLEDADACFVPRAGDNMGSIASLLNLGDGILGSLLDMRILATTNAKKFQVDPAILRNGRLCRHIEIQPLSHERAAAALRSICHDGKLTGYANAVGQDITFGESTSLADVYARARKLGWTPPPADRGDAEERMERMQRRRRRRRR